MNLPDKPVLDPARHCGDCQACCTAMGVAELDKAPGARCDKLCASGCAAYDTRPQSCRDFVCLWRLGVGRLMERPDRVGFFLDLTEPGSKLGRQFMIAREANPGSFDDSTVRDRLGELSAKHVVFLVRGSERTMIGPPDEVEKLAKRVKLMAKGE